jgi:hypothetical protein
MTHFTYYTIIGKDLNLLKGHVENVKAHAGFDKLECSKEFIVVIYTNPKIDPSVTQSIVEYCNENNLKTVFYEEPSHLDFLHNLYTCWNLGYEFAQPGYVFRGGSDQVFSEDSFVALYNAAQSLDEQGKKYVLQANTIECTSRLRKINAISRHFSCDFGYNFSNMNIEAFENFVTTINMNVDAKLLNIYQALKHWGHPTPIETTVGQINRCDGCSWLMSKQDWIDFGPIPPFDGSITGDVAIHDYLMNAGYMDYIVRDCVTYHFVQGERTT